MTLKNLSRRKVGRPKEYSTKQERKVTSFRVTQKDKESIIKKYGSVQAFINEMIKLHC